ncbi:MAG TPA: sensor histidine kinase [Trebonia sp.]|nr:sensor histidine kinase [Trebonia sp.]
MPDHLPLAQSPRLVTAPPPHCTPAPDRRHAWETGTLTWDAFYLLVFLAVLVIVLISKPSSVLAAAAMGAMIVWYLVLGRPLWTGTRLLLARGRPGRTWAVVYVTGIFVLFGLVQSQNSSAWFLAFAFCPQFFSFASGRVAIWLGIALNFAAAALLVAHDPTAGAAVVAFAVATAGCGFSIFYSGWVTRIIEQSAERAEIIDQLEATRAQLATAQHEAGRMAERQRLAADIHDTLAQGFASIVMLIQAAQANLDGSRPQAASHLDTAERTARENLAEARALVAGLTPAMLDGGTLPDALRRLCDASGVDTTFGLTGEPAVLPMATEVVLLRVGQEALSNVRKHARARSVTVQLSYDPLTVALEVSDDGQGFDPAGVDGGFGLRGMRSRVAEVGGTLTVDSQPGRGTQVSVAVPA